MFINTEASKCKHVTVVTAGGEANFNYFIRSDKSEESSDDKRRWKKQQKSSDLF